MSRSHCAGSREKHLGADYFPCPHRIVCGIMDCGSSVRASHCFDCSYIADCTTVEERSKYMARLEAFLAAAYIFGPAVGGFLGELGLGVPFIVAGVVAAINLILVCVVLHESLDLTLEIKNTRQKFSYAYLKRLFPPMVVRSLFVRPNSW